MSEISKTDSRQTTGDSRVKRTAEIPFQQRLSTTPKQTDVSINSIPRWQATPAHQHELKRRNDAALHDILTKMNAETSAELEKHRKNSQMRIDGVQR